MVPISLMIPCPRPLDMVPIILEPRGQGSEHGFLSMVRWSPDRGTYTGCSQGITVCLHCSESPGVGGGEGDEEGGGAGCGAVGGVEGGTGGGKGCGAGGWGGGRARGAVGVGVVGGIGVWVEGGTAGVT